MEPRMNHPVFVVPGALEALHGLGEVAAKTGVPFATLKMVELRASQINGCSAQLSGLLLDIGTINVWNRVNAATRQVAGGYDPD